MQTREFVNFAQSGSVSYNSDRKAKFHSGAASVLRRLVKLLGLKKGEYTIRHNQGGIAVSGEITLHADRVYIQFSQSAIGSSSGKDSAGVLWRTCNGQKDYTGGRNHWSKWEDLRDLDAFAEQVKAIMAPAFVVVE